MDNNTIEFNATVAEYDKTLKEAFSKIGEKDLSMNSLRRLLKVAVAGPAYEMYLTIPTGTNKAHLKENEMLVEILKLEELRMKLLIQNSQLDQAIAAEKAQDAQSS